MHASQSFFRQHGWKSCEGSSTRDEQLRSEASRTQSGLATRQFNRVHIEADEPTARPQAFEQGPRMTASAERTVQAHLARDRTEALQDFVHHDGEVQARGSLAGGENLFHLPGILRRVQFLVFLVVLARILARIAAPTAVSRRLLGRTVVHAVLYWPDQQSPLPKRYLESVETNAAA